MNNDLWKANPADGWANKAKYESGWASLSFGGGVNSTAILCGFVEAGYRPDRILFADTGGEKPETYRLLEWVAGWLAANGFPAIDMIRERNRHGEPVALEDACLRNSTMPSKVFGRPACSVRWKIDPMGEYLNRLPEVIEARESGRQTYQFIGFDAGEAHRKAHEGSRGFASAYPLLEWQWDREDCIAALKRHGFPKWEKSACFFCPSMKIHEILALPDDLKARAVAMEDRAIASGKLRTVKGLGRHWTWRSVLAANGEGFEDGALQDEPCVTCHDGGGCSNEEWEEPDMFEADKSEGGDAK